MGLREDKRFGAQRASAQFIRLHPQRPTENTLDARIQFPECLFNHG